MVSLLFGFMQIGWADITPQPRIINGNIALNTQIPWQVALITQPLDPYQSYTCSGSLIADRWIVTAAHCIQELKQKNKDAYVLVGTHHLQDTQHGQIIKAKQDYIHEQYNDQTYDNDIALIELVEPVNFSQCGKSCQTIDAIYPEIEKQYAPISSFVQIAGWGIIEDCENSHSLICQQYSGQMIRNPELYPTILRYTTLKQRWIRKFEQLL